MDFQVITLLVKEEVLKEMTALATSPGVSDYPAYKYKLGLIDGLERILTICEEEANKDEE